MDPDALIVELRSIVADMLVNADAHTLPDGTMAPYAAQYAAQQGARLAGLVEALDQWILRGGFLPASWTLAQREAAQR